MTNERASSSFYCGVIMQFMHSIADYMKKAPLLTLGYLH